MSPSSTRAVDGSNSATEPENTTANSQIIIVHHILDNFTYNLDRFLGHVGEVPTDQQRSPPGFGATQGRAVTEAEVETREQERISTQLQEFDVKFSSCSAVSCRQRK
ncbi:hypothetical protein CI102_13375 [Trichoderma harzianum]|nr:hypothetical protein CI102_13375 [Trichoderma harzianum]